MPERPLRRRVDLHDAAPVVHRDDAIERGIEDRGCSRVAVVQRLLRAPALDILAELAPEARGGGPQCAVGRPRLPREQLDGSDYRARPANREAEGATQTGASDDRLTREALLGR